MSKLTINIGDEPNDRRGDSLRTAFQKVNENFTELYTSLGLDTDITLNLGAFEFDGSVMTTTDSTPIVIDQATTVTSDLTVGGDIVPSVANGGNLGSLSKPFRSLYVSEQTVYFGGIPLSLSSETNELQINNIPISQTITYADIPNSPTVPQDISDLTDTEGLLGGGGAGPVQPYLELSDSPFIIQAARLGDPVEFTRTAEGSETDSIDIGLTLARGSNGALYNIESEVEYDDNNHTSPLGTEWNSDGWGNLVGLVTRTYTTFREALNGAVGNNIIGAELVMHDTINDRYYKFGFSDWGGNNGGSFAYTRTLVEDPNYFKKADYATANNVDVIEDDSTLQIGITRGNNNGIYNPFTEDGWDSDVSPQGTLWNIDGWDNLTDIETRIYTNFYAAYGNGGLGNKVPGSRAVIYVPSIEKYYAIQWFNWTQNNVGGGFSYLRYELDLTKLNEGVRFADGTVQKTAYVPTNVKLRSLGERRIEEAYGYKEVTVTVTTTGNTITTTAANSNNGGTWQVDIVATGAEYDTLIALNQGDAFYQIEISADENTWITGTVGGYNPDAGTIQIVFNDGATLAFDENDTVYYRILSGGDPVIWWDKDDLPGGSSDFRGAVIDYHAYIPGRGTIVGTIHIVDDSGEENITHTEVSSGASDLEYSDLWYVTDEGEIKYRQLDNNSRTLKIQWTAKVFYGSEYYDD